MAKLYKLPVGTLGYSIETGLLLAIIFGVIAGLSTVATGLGTTPTLELIILAVVAGLSAGLQHYQNPTT
jgi:cation transporter-like permease